MKLITIISLFYSTIVLSDCDTFYKDSVYDVYDMDFTKNIYEEEFKKYCESNGQAKNLSANVSYYQITGAFSQDKMTVNNFCRTYHNIVTNNVELKVNRRTVIRNAHALYNQCKAIENGDVTIDITSANPSDWARFNISIVSQNKFQLNSLITPVNNKGKNAVSCNVKVNGKKVKSKNRAINIDAYAQLSLVCDRIPDKSDSKIKFVEGSVILNLTGLVKKVLEIPLNPVPTRLFLEDLLIKIDKLDKKLVASKTHKFLGEDFNPQCYYYAVNNDGTRYNFAYSSKEQLGMDHSSGGFIRYKKGDGSKIETRASSGSSSVYNQATIFEVCDNID